MIETRRRIRALHDELFEVDLDYHLARQAADQLSPVQVNALAIRASAKERSSKNESTAAIEAELAELRKTLTSKQRIAAKLEGFELLNAPQTLVTSERLQGALGGSEALVLAFSHGKPMVDPLTAKKGPDTSEKGYVLVLRNSGEPTLITCPELPVLTSRIRAFTYGLSGRGNVRLGGWDRSGNQPSKDDAIGQRIIDEQDAMSEPEMESFWSDQSRAMQTTLWDPLVESGALEGVDRILLATAGDLHNLPFEPGREAAGAPEMFHVNSLAMFALGRGLYNQSVQGSHGVTRTSTGEPAPFERSLATVLCWPGEYGEPSYLPFANAERDATHALWVSRLGRDAVTSGSSHPWEPAEDVDVLHVACHGDVLKEKDRTPRPVMRLRPEGEIDSGLVGEREFLKGPKAREILMNICVGGQVFDDSFDGNPTGLVAGALRHGAHTIVASLLPVPDEHGYLFGVLATLLMTDRGLALAAATGVAKRVMAGVPKKDDDADGLIRLFCETRAKRLMRLMELDDATLEQELWQLTNNDPNMSWLDDTFIADLIGDRPKNLSDMTDFVHGRTTILSELAQDPAASGVITYGMTVFGDPIRIKSK